jgi:2-polyprenyl-6-methoxyphenol hydroxylase-like FAD-dependent oxidoreductase
MPSLAPVTVTEPLTVCIAGAGLAGLAFASRLKTLRPTANIFLCERDPNIDARAQGIVIGLQQGGADALIDMGLESVLDANFVKPHPDTATDMIIRNGGGWRLIDVKRVMLVKNSRNVWYSSLVNRAQLRRALAEYVPGKGIEIKWGYAFHSYDVQPDGQILVHFNDRKISLLCDVLVGADGAKSKVRALRCPQLTPIDLGVWGVAGSFTLADPHELNDNNLLRLACRAMTRTNGWHGVSILCFAHVQSDGQRKLLWSLSMPKARAGLLVDERDIDKARATCVQIVKESFASGDVAQIISLTPTSEWISGYPFTSVLPATLKKAPYANYAANVTLIGDAAHKTTTQAGMGATAAFQDSRELARLLGKVRTKAELSDALRAFEREMEKRAYSIVSMSAGNTRKLHDTRLWVVVPTNAILWCVGCIIAGVQSVR